MNIMELIKELSKAMLIHGDDKEIFIMDDYLVIYLTDDNKMNGRIIYEIEP